MSSGWVKSHRNTWESCAWGSCTTEGRCVLMAILWGCCYVETVVIIDGERRTLKPGQWLTSIDKIAERAGKNVSKQNVRTAIKHLEISEFLTNEITKGNKRIITVTNWKFYQHSDGLTDDLTDSQQTTNRRLTDDQQTSNSIQERKKERIKELKEKNYSESDKELFDTIFNKWNSHTILTDHLQSRDKPNFQIEIIKRAKKIIDLGYGTPDICKSIDNYSEARKTGFHKWGLLIFLKQENACVKFIDYEPSSFEKPRKAINPLPDSPQWGEKGET